MARDSMSFGGRRRPHTSNTKQCRECGIDFRPRGGQSTRYCGHCSAARARFKASRRKKRRTRAVSRPKIPGWKDTRRAGLEPCCAACGEEFEKPGDAAVDHIVSAAIVAELNRLDTKTVGTGLVDYDAEDKLNLWSACRKCHGKKRRAEIKLELADTMGFLAELNRIGFPIDRAKKALALYGLLR